MRVDAVVNAANSRLEQGSGVFAALEKMYALKREAEAEWAAKAPFEEELLRGGNE